MSDRRSQEERETAAGRRARTGASVAVEALEGRQLMTAAGLHRHVPSDVIPLVEKLGLPVGTPGSNLYDHPGPIKAEIGKGFVVKSLRFYPYYTGPIQAVLNAASSTALVVNGGTTLELNGEVGGQIVTAPTTPEDGEIYVFGINRGGATLAPFPNRPGIQFNAVVVVQITPSGVSGFVENLGANPSVTAINPADIEIMADTVKVFVPVSAVPPTGPGGVAAYSVNFWAQDPGVSADPTAPAGAAVASFASEFRMYPVKVSNATVNVP